jgi:hypothetical protein
MLQFLLTGYHGTSHVANPGSSVPWFQQQSIRLEIEVLSTTGMVAVTLLVGVDAPRMRGHVDTDFSYLDLLFDNNKVLSSNLYDLIKDETTSRTMVLFSLI